MMSANMETREDFDRIALLSEEGWGHNEHYHRFLLRQLPSHCASALDIGCGTGAFSRCLAARAERVVALDLSPEMIRVARRRSTGIHNIEFRVADTLSWPFPPDEFDCVASIATLHHLPLRETLGKMRDTLRAGGALVALDLYARDRWRNRLIDLAAAPVSLTLRLLKTGRLREPAAIRDAWAEHGKHDTYVTLSQVRRVCDALLPGAQVRRHLLWRYSVTWHKPDPRGLR